MGKLRGINETVAFDSRHKFSSQARERSSRRLSSIQVTSDRVRRHHRRVRHGLHRDPRHGRRGLAPRRRYARFSAGLRSR